MSENASAMVRAGINAYKLGNKDEARALLLKAVELDPYSEEGWLWLSGLLESKDDQRTALENVLAINPTNDRARKGLDFLLGKAAPAPTPPPAPPPAPPPPAKSSSARASEVSTSVEWASPADAASSAASAFVPRSDPQDVDYDQWVTDLNLPPQAPRTGINIPAGGSLFLASEDDTTFDDSTFTQGPFDAAAIFAEDAESSPNARAKTASATPAFDVDEDDYLPADAAAAIAAASAAGVAPRAADAIADEALPKASPFGDVDLDAADAFESRAAGKNAPAKTAKPARDKDAERAAKAAAKAERVAAKAAAKRSKAEIDEEDRLEMDDTTRAIVESLQVIPREIEPTRLPGTRERQPILLVIAAILLVVLNIGAAVMLINRILVPLS
jgi:tetratricopeptide (TPR) repeat protein